MSGIRHITRYGEKRLQAKADDDSSAFIELVCGPCPYLWIGTEEEAAYATVSGAQTLRRLAEAILAELKATR